MKPTLLFPLAAALLAAGCKKDDPKAMLPPATQEGKNVGGCLIEGEVWQTSPGQGLFASATGTRALVSKRAGQSTYTIKIGLSSDSPSSRLIEFACFGASGVGAYSFTQKLPSYTSPTPEPDNAQYHNRKGNGPTGDFSTGPAAPGQMTITRFDLQKHIVAGTFSFVAQDSVSGRKVNLTDGRFDVEFVYLELP
ncbi:DUF6252 family protein [Hymenobacter properus]|uniref:Lipoprotein n=1 Tax=Hymenobacter properus TaxID=2791026 RepID=A0A931BHT5_9BACT|nr:DUF6252 family protein [Hymenobacter properus]MBF9142613.1 hypothetical protein [Hymenobacter properus]MBR7721421.1 hypothetical protein [Microvirga sp. SRT04]